MQSGLVTVYTIDHLLALLHILHHNPAEEFFVASERNAKLRYEGYKKLSEM